MPARTRRRSGQPQKKGQPARPLPWGSVLAAATALGLALVLYLIYGASETLSLPVRRGTALLSAWTYSALGGEAAVSGTVINAGPVHFLVVNDCTPVGVVLLVWGAMLASPAGWRSKLLGVGLAAVALTLLNLVRVVSLLALGLWLPGRLETVHLLVWQPLMLLAAMLLWLLWLEGTRRDAVR